MDYNLLKNLRTWENSGSGIAAQLLIAPMTWFVPNTGIKSPVAPFATAGDQITIKEAHEFIDGKGFIYFALARGKNQLDVPIVGDPGFTKQNQEATVFIPGNTPDLHAIYQTLMNVPSIALVKDSNCKADLWMQLGCDCEGAFLGGPFNTGTTQDGVKGFNAKVVYDGAVQFYQPGTSPLVLADQS